MPSACYGTDQRAATNWGFTVDCLSKAKEKKRKKKNLLWVPPNEVLARWWVAIDAGRRAGRASPALASPVPLSGLVSPAPAQPVPLSRV